MMSKETLKEILYLFCGIVAGLVISYFFNANPFCGDCTIGINLNDTYYLIVSHYIWMGLVLCCIFLLFSARTIFSRIGTRLGKFILIISGISVVLCLTKINGIISAMKGLMINSFEDDPPSQIKMLQEINSMWDAGSHILVLLQFLMVVLLIFSVYRFSKTTKL